MRWLLVLILLALAAPAHADEARPLYIEARESTGNVYDISWRLPPTFAPAMAPEMVLPTDCTVQGTGREWSDGIGHWREARWQCRQPMGGRNLAIGYPQGNPNLATIFKAQDAAGGSTIGVFLPGVASLPFPAPDAQASGSLFIDYLVLGIEHIWLGLDHLLFVACLIWIAGSPRRILATITGFTVAHSLTLVLAALEVVAAPVRTIEVLIALSIVLLAVELARHDRTTITWRYPVAVSTSFGLLHGFGFAAVLGEIGLPQDGLVPALFAFNLGIEIGQLIFAAVLIAASRAVLALAGRITATAADGSALAVLPDYLRIAVAYVVGITSTFWILERMS